MTVFGTLGPTFSKLNVGNPSYTWEFSIVLIFFPINASNSRAKKLEQGFILNIVTMHFKNTMYELQLLQMLPKFNKLKIALKKKKNTLYKLKLYYACG